MKRKRPSNLLPVLALLSLLTGTALSLGYLGRFGPNLSYISQGKTPNLENNSLLVANGCLLWQRVTAVPLPLTMIPRIRHRGYLVSFIAAFHLPKIGKSVWQFDLPVRSGMKQGMQFSEIRVPIWSVLWATLIAPLLWVKRRRRERTQTGFAVVDIHDHA